jgi:hypothetical protein
MKPTLFAGLVATICLATPALSQDKPQKKVTEISTTVDIDQNETNINGLKKGKIKIVRNINGKEEVIEEEFSGSMTEEFKKKMDDLDIKMGKEGGKTHIFITPSGKDLETFEKNKVQATGKIKIVRNINGKEEVIEREFDGKMPEDLKKELNNIKMNEVDGGKSHIWINTSKDVKIDSKDSKNGKVMIFSSEGNKDLPEDVKKMLAEKGVNLDLDGKDFVFINKIGKDNENSTQTYKLTDGKEVKVCISKICVIHITKDEAKKEQEASAEAETKTADEPKVADLMVYPNPNDGAFNLKFNLEQKGDAQVTLHDQQGNVLYEETLKDFSGEFQKPLNLRGQKAGNYVLKIVQNGKVYTRQVVVK